MTSKTDTAKQLIHLATDGTHTVDARLAALEQADTLRKELKIGWAKLGAADIQELRTELTWAVQAFADRGLAPGTYEEWLALPALKDDDLELSPEVEASLTSPFTEAPFEMTDEELADQALRPTTMADIWQADADEGHRAALGAQYKELVGYDPFEDDPLISVEEVEKMIADFQAEARKSVPFEEMTLEEKVDLAESLGLEVSKQPIDPRPLETNEGEYGRWRQTDDGPMWVKANEAEVEAWIKAGELADRINEQLSHQQDFVPPTVVSEPEADKPEPEASEEPQKLTSAERGAIGVMSRDLLQTSMSYEDIALAIRERYPHAKTTARSLASVAADMRRDGIPCPSRRKGGK